MSDRARAPSSTQVVRAIARRDFILGSRRKLVRLLFLASTLPPLVLIIILVVRMIAKQATGFDLEWDPMLVFLQFQALPVALLSLGLGTPSVSRDRAEEVLFLYATRPVLPWHYSLGKMLAVAVPAGSLLLLPGILIAILRFGVVGDYSAADVFDMILKLFIASTALAWGFAGISVGPSAAVRRSRWALLIALAFFIFPDAVGESVLGVHAVAFGPSNAIERLLSNLFEMPEELLYGLGNIIVLLAYGSLGMLVTTFRVRKEMIP